MSSEGGTNTITREWCHARCAGNASEWYGVDNGATLVAIMNVGPWECKADLVKSKGLEKLIQAAAPMSFNGCRA